MHTGDEKTKLKTAISEALELIACSGADPGNAVKSTMPLESLLDKCRSMHQQTLAARDEPIGIIHHFACSGGTIISKCIAAMPGSVFLSEIDPLSKIRTASPPRFAPTDIIEQLIHSRHRQPDSVLVDMFLASISALYKATQKNGQRLVIRDHPHSQFCLDVDWTARPTVHEIIGARHRVQSVITVRHPMASYLSLCHNIFNNKWDRFFPTTLEQYAIRYSAFLDRHSDCPIIYYEDFVNNTEATLMAICKALDLSYVPGIPTLISIVKMSGDSGRGGDVIKARAKRPVPENTKKEIGDSPSYQQLCKKLGYDPDFV